jgi:hypothetical protein
VKSIWAFVTKHEFWFLVIIIVGLCIGEYQTREMWMGNFAFLLFLVATTRLAMHPVWKKDDA